MHQALGGGGVAAVGDDHLAVGVAVALQLQHEALQCAVLAPGLAQNVQLAHIAGLADDPDVEHPRHSGHGGLHPAIAGQIRQRFQREEQVGVAAVAQHLLADVVKRHPLGQQVADVLGQQHQLRPCGEAVQHKDPCLRVLGLILLGGQLGGVAAARQGAGDGDGVDLVRALVGPQPVADVGAGGAGLALVGPQGGRHLHGVQRAIVEIFPLVGHDLEGDGGKIYAVQLIQAGRRVHNDSFHLIYLHSGGCPPHFLRSVSPLYQFFKNLSSDS